MEIQYTIYKEDLHLDQVATLEMNLWHNISQADLMQIFKWKFPENSPIRTGFVALDGDRVIGFKGYFINYYTLGGSSKIAVAILSDSVTHPEYQRRGIFKNLTEYSLTYYKQNGLDCMLALTSNEKASSGYIKLGWEPLAHRAIRLKLNLHSIFSHPTRYIKKLSKADIHIVHLSSISLKTATGLEEFCKTEYCPNQIELLKDTAYWMRRYAAPHWKYNFIILYNKQNQIIGYVSYMKAISDYKNIQHTKILDISANNCEILLQCVMRTCNSPIILINTTSPKQGLSVWIKKRFPFQRLHNQHDASDYALIKWLNQAKGQQATDMQWGLGYIDMDSM